MTAQFIDPTAEVRGRGIIRCQEITKDFLDDLHCARAASRDRKAAEMERVAAVPTSLVDNWLARGLPFWEMSSRAIVDQLDRDNLQAFISTEKRV